MKKASQFWQLSLACILLIFSTNIWAAVSPVGYWKTIDDKTGKRRGIVYIYSANPVRGRIYHSWKIPGRPWNTVCDKCKGSRHNKKLIGMTIMWGYKKTGPNEWTGGRILDTETGTIYRSKFTINGNVMNIRGYIGVSLLGRTQKWYRLSAGQAAALKRQGS